MVARGIKFGLLNFFFPIFLFFPNLGAEADVDGMAGMGNDTS